MQEKDKENVHECVHTFTYAVTSLFLGRKGVISGKSYLLAGTGPRSPQRCKVLVQTSFVLNGNHPLGCIFMRKLNSPLQASSFESVLPAINTTTLQAFCSHFSSS